MRNEKLSLLRGPFDRGNFLMLRGSGKPFRLEAPSADGFQLKMSSTWEVRSGWRKQNYRAVNPYWMTKTEINVSAFSRLTSTFSKRNQINSHWAGHYMEWYGRRYMCCEKPGNRSFSSVCVLFEFYFEHICVVIIAFYACLFCRLQSLSQISSLMHLCCSMNKVYSNMLEIMGW